MTGEDEGGSREGAGWRSYRCPVCGHSDEVAVVPSEVMRIRCSHCDTLLEVEGGKGEWAAVQVADDGAQGSGS